MGQVRGVPGADEGPHLGVWYGCGQGDDDSLEPPRALVAVGQ
jgi:hypothetical protein